MQGSCPSLAGVPSDADALVELPQSEVAGAAAIAGPFPDDQAAAAAAAGGTLVPTVVGQVGLLPPCPATLQGYLMGAVAKLLNLASTVENAGCGAASRRGV